jgi:pimeloyl-ACP methyl ester carboxylesterase
MEFLGRFTARTQDRDIFTTLAARDAQYDAIVEWGVPDHNALTRLAAISQPTLVIQGDNDLMIPTRNRRTVLTGAVRYGRWRMIQSGMSVRKSLRAVAGL